jgi:hypothetical protein
MILLTVNIYFIAPSLEILYLLPTSISVTNLGLKSLKRPKTRRFHFLYWEVSGAQETFG